MASASPRRRRLLREAGLAIEVEPAGVDESLAQPLPPMEAACLLAERKATFVAARHCGRDALVIGADTIVAFSPRSRPETASAGDEHHAPWTLLGKPDGEEQAASMLRRLSDSRHQVVTGVCVVDARSGLARTESERTWVSMRRITDEEVERYVASGEWRGKAGGYAIQETADAFVTSLEGGGFDNVVGLPVELTRSLLRDVLAVRGGGSLAPPDSDR